MSIPHFNIVNSQKKSALQSFKKELYPESKISYLIYLKKTRDITRKPKRTKQHTKNIFEIQIPHVSGKNITLNNEPDTHNKYMSNAA